MSRVILMCRYNKTKKKYTKQKTTSKAAMMLEDDLLTLGLSDSLD